MAIPETKNSTRSLKSIFTELDKIRKAYRQKYRGYRDQIYVTMQSVQGLIAELETNKKARISFLKKISEKKAKFPVATINLSMEVVSLAFGAATRQARQKASKRGQALDYLRKKKVPVPKTAATLRKWGGIEKVADTARSSRPLTARSGQTEKSNDSQPVKSNHKPNDTELKVPVWMKLSVRDEIEEHPAGATLKLTALRIGQKGGELKIIKVKVIKNAEASEASGSTKRESSDW